MSASLNLYSHRPGAFDPQDVGIAHMYAAQASIALAAADEVDNLPAALKTRHTIGVAQGILRAHLSLEADSAFEVLRRFSQDYNLKLRDVVDDIVSGTYAPLLSR
ncbi:ANTAR domain-containing protein [Pedococcus sp. 5OH_020]|uniref:ANTAR domain-containing protein n=1 Tax=Pedococcus sp. 5OH_020 TaxID=2989814 RepID=UPI0022E9C1F4|nr:ANTAR domain-containing protein [Pedococcus sp. 5OH_020]